MKQLYIKFLFPGLLSGILLLQLSNVCGQRLSPNNRDRLDLIANVQKIESDLHKISRIKKQIEDYRNSENKKSVEIHKEKLAVEKKNLKEHYQNAKEEECSYRENKNNKIDALEKELKEYNAKYALIRKQIKKDLSNKNDFALQKDAADLLKAVQLRNEISTALSMEKSDLLATTDALDAEWRKVKLSRKQPRENEKPSTDNSSLSTVK